MRTQKSPSSQTQSEWTFAPNRAFCSKAMRRYRSARTEHFGRALGGGDRSVRYPEGDRNNMARHVSLCLDQIPGLPPTELGVCWSRLYGKPAPAVAPDLLRLGLAYALQAQRNGGLPKPTKTLLRRASECADSPATPKLPTRKLTPGTMLVRDWHGVGHTVTVLDRGFEYDGKSWPSLSAIAKAITGAHWNGPRFFGLAERRK